ncbi:hypothetical protein AX14_007333 [Amanita brunnescens Koide BX004]|nr:hypothetical protein AX14_007333 [Amanita brunnescens Koide BX004]
MASFSGPPPGLTRPKSSDKSPPFPLSPPLPSHPAPPLVSPIPRRAASAAWGSSLVGGLFPPTFDLPPKVPHGIQPSGEAVQTTDGLYQRPLSDNTAITDLAVFPAPSPSDPWHIAHARVCAHATQTCAACSVAFVCCSCRALRFTPGTPPLTAPSPPLRRSRPSSPALFRNVGNGPSPLGFNNMDILPDDDAYIRALAECDTCDNSSCPRGSNEPATWSIMVERFDEGAEEHYDQIFRACGACNRTCKRSFLGCKIKSCVFDNSTRRPLPMAAPQPSTTADFPLRATNDSLNAGPVSSTAQYACEHPTNATTQEARAQDSIASLTLTTTIPCKLLCSPPLFPSLLRSLNSCTHTHLSPSSLSLSSEHGPQYRSTSRSFEAKNFHLHC